MSSTRISSVYTAETTIDDKVVKVLFGHEDGIQYAQVRILPPEEGEAYRTAYHKWDLLDTTPERPVLRVKAEGPEIVANKSENFDKDEVVQLKNLLQYYPVTKIFSTAFPPVDPDTHDDDETMSRVEEWIQVNKTEIEAAMKVGLGWTPANAPTTPGIEGENSTIGDDKDSLEQPDQTGDTDQSGDSKRSGQPPSYAESEANSLLAPPESADSKQPSTSFQSNATGQTGERA